MNTDKIYAKKIASEYANKQTSKVKQLKRLDKWIRKPTIIFAYTFGIISSLILGLGMCLSMKVIGTGTLCFIIGLILGIVGIVCVSVNYYIYCKILERRKKENANDVLLLAQEIIDENP